MKLKMKLIRHNVFETNSSSTHSISVVAGAKVYDTIYPNEDGCINLVPEDFGWDWAAYHWVHDKLLYLLIYARDWSGANSQQFTDQIWEVVCEHTGATSIVIQPIPSPYGNSDDIGYIDHQAVEDNDLHWMFMDENSNQILKDFIFNPNSILRTGNDNSYCPYNWEDFPEESDYD